jgi:hypothetical protein
MVGVTERKVIMEHRVLSIGSRVLLLHTLLTETDQNEKNRRRLAERIACGFALPKT